MSFSNINHCRGAPATPGQTKASKPGPECHATGGPQTCRWAWEQGGLEEPACSHLGLSHSLLPSPPSAGSCLSPQDRAEAVRLLQPSDSAVSASPGNQASGLKCCDFPGGNRSKTVPDSGSLAAQTLGSGGSSACSLVTGSPWGPAYPTPLTRALSYPQPQSHQKCHRTKLAPSACPTLARADQTSFPPGTETKRCWSVWVLSSGRANSEPVQAVCRRTTWPRTCAGGVQKDHVAQVPDDRQGLSRWQASGPPR